jgi:chromosome segregation ATPase
MSKRAKTSSSSESQAVEKAAVLENKLFELQAYTYDVLVKNSAYATQSGSVRSTRAFADPLLMKEIEILRTRETELTEKVLSLEKKKGAPSTTSAKDALIQELRVENEKLREQLGDVGQQVSKLRMDVKDSHIAALEKEVAELKGANKALEGKRAEAEGKVYKLELALAKAEETGKESNKEFDTFFGDS